MSKILKLNADELRKKLNIRDGIKGEKGDKGDKGDPGKDGKDGKQGQRGPIGPKGNDGETGPEGKKGKDGKSYLLPNIKKTVDKEIEKVKKDIVKVAVKDSADLVMKNPELITMPQFRAMGMGLRGDIDANTERFKNYILGDGINKITVGAVEPTNPNIGDLWLDQS